MQIHHGSPWSENETKIWEKWSNVFRARLSKHCKRPTDIEKYSLTKTKSAAKTFQKIAERKILFPKISQWCLNFKYFMLFFRCDVGNWRLVNITLNIDDVSSLHGSARFPPTLLSSWSRTLSSNALALLTGVNVQRSYRCDSQLTAKMTVSRAESLTANQSTSTGQWKVNLDLLHFSVEPFLVNVPNDGQLPVFKDPLLCTWVSFWDYCQKAFARMCNPGLMAAALNWI